MILSLILRLIREYIRYMKSALSTPVHIADIHSDSPNGICITHVLKIRALADVL